MHGAGTKPEITPNNPPARLLDLSRLVSRVGRGPLTGIDRVEMAYFHALLHDSIPMFSLVQFSGSFVILDQSGSAELFKRMIGKEPWGKPDFQSLIRRKLSQSQRCAQSDCRHLGVKSGRRLSELMREIPHGSSYINVGHSNLNEKTFQAFRMVSGRASVLIHDFIPLDFPEFQRENTVNKFKMKMKVVSAFADLVIYNSAKSQRDGDRHFRELGRVPEGIVSHLGVTVAKPSDTDIAQKYGLVGPYFVTVGTIEPRKNHALLLDVWEQFDNSQSAPILVIIGGRGWNNDAVFDRLDEHPKNVIELNNLPDREVARLVQKCNGMLFPSRAEGFGLPPAEALLLGTPSICADLPVYREFLGDKPIYLDPEDRYLWRRGIETLANKRPAREAVENIDISVPTWTEHFNRVLRIV